MFIFTRRSGLELSNEYKNETFYLAIKDFLRRRIQQYHTPDYVVHEFYLETPDSLLIPRYFNLDRFIKQYEILDRTEAGAHIDIQHNIKPRNEIQEKAIKFLMEHDHGILQLLPGVGKTVVSIYMVGERKRKTLILVHKDSLADQWIGKKDYAPNPPQGFLAFTNLTENDIARLTSATFKEDLQKPVIVCTDQTFISLLKRNRQEFLDELHKARIGIFIADEVHTTVGAQTFSECSIHVPARYTFGLSATPYRNDGTSDVIQYHLGPIWSEEASDTMDVNVTVILADLEVDTKKRSVYLRWGGVFQKSRYVNLLRKSIKFTNIMKGLLTKLVRDDRNFLIVMERLNVIDDFFNWLNVPDKSKFVGSANMSVLKSKAVFATPGKIRDGVDAPHKDCLVMTSPIGNIEQLTGRVVRTFPGKKTPIFIDLVDIGCKDVMKTFNHRLSFYERKNWKVKFIILFDGKMNEITRETSLEILNEEK
jgi:hypothetical protein